MWIGVCYLLGGGVGVGYSGWWWSGSGVVVFLVCGGGVDVVDWDGGSGVCDGKY